MREEIDMVDLHFSIIIKATRKKVWDIMLGEDTFRKWTEAFMPGSHFIGDWSRDSKILFLAPGKNGESGMVSRIQENRRHEFVSIEHLGVVQDGIEDMSSDAAKIWAGGFENYGLREVDSGTEVLVDMGGPDVYGEYRDMFEATWPAALQRLKELAEKKETGILKKKLKAKSGASSMRRRRKKVISRSSRIKRRR